MFCQKIDQNFWEKEKSLLCMGRNHILFKLDLIVRRQVEKKPAELTIMGTQQKTIS
jgi:hypothetical protein